MGVLFKQIPAVVVSVLLVSLVEALFILTAHLASDDSEKSRLKIFMRPQEYISNLVEQFTQGAFRRFVRRSIRKPATILLYSVTLMLITASGIAGGLLGFSFTPSIESDTVIAQATLPYGTPREKSIAIQNMLVKDAQAVMSEVAMKSPGVFSLIGARLEEGEIEEGTLSGTHYVSVIVSLPEERKRVISGRELANLWQKSFGHPPGIDVLSFTGETNVTGGEPIRLELFHPDDSVAQKAAIVLGERMRMLPELTAVDDGLRAGKPELIIKLKEHGIRMGLTTHDVARQIRHRFHGADAGHIMRNGLDVKVMVRLPENERKLRSSLENALIKTSDGNLIPISEVATITQGKSTTILSRRDGKRIYPVTADVVVGIDDDLVEEILEEEILPEILFEYPGLKIGIGGEEEEGDESLAALGNGFIIVLGVIYVLLAIKFNSYIQPLIVLSVIPFAFIGAIWGHILLGYDLSIISVIGIIAMAGVVVNDSLVLVTAYNSMRASGFTHTRAIIEAACRRLHPILLTTLTTFFGLMPMLMETSEQAQFLIPMAVSLTFGLLFGTFIVLILLPSLLMMTKPVSKINT
jgi:multidrug efflux pump subunit AcrB